MNALTVVVRSTTGTAPVTLARVPGGVHIDLEDASAQVYSAVELAAAVRAVTLNAPTPARDGWDEPGGYWPTEPTPAGAA